MPGWFVITIAVVAVLLALGWVCRRLLLNPRADVTTGLVFHVLRFYASRVHNLTVDGLEHIPDSRTPGPLIVVANHTSGVDPLLIQAVCPFEVRWLMAEDMRLGWMEPFWRWAGVIFIDRRAPNLAPLREALAHLEAGGVIGIFPEGGIERPPCAVLPFLRGVGVLIKKSGAPVLPVLIRGTPNDDTAWGSLTSTSRSNLTVLRTVRHEPGARKPDQIADDLRAKFMEWSGWPPNDDPAPLDAPGGKPARA